jgi:hypothetical protein
VQEEHLVLVDLLIQDQHQLAKEVLLVEAFLVQEVVQIIEEEDSLEDKMKKIIIGIISLLSMIFISCSGNNYGDLENKNIIIMENVAEHVVENFKEGASSINKIWAIFDLSKDTTCESLGFVEKEGKVSIENGGDSIIKKYFHSQHEDLTCIYVGYVEYSYDYGSVSKLMTINKSN